MNNLKSLKNRKTFLLGLAFLLVCLLAGALFCGCSDSSVTEKPPPASNTPSLAVGPSPTPSATVTVTVTGSTTEGESTAGSVGMQGTAATPDSVATPDENLENVVTFPPEWGDFLPTDEGTTAEATTAPTKSTPSSTPTKSVTATEGSTTAVASPTATTEAPATTESENTVASPDVDGPGWSGWY